MRVLLTSEARFERTPDGAIWGPAAYGEALWARYLEVFSSVLVAARVARVARASAGSIRASRSRVEFCELPPYEGISGLMRSLWQLRQALEAAVHRTEAVVVRSPSPLASLIARAATGARRSYAAEIVGDPNLVFSPGAFRHPLRGGLRFVATAAQRQIARDAVAALYVTSEVLQRQYPTRGQAFAASDVALDDGAFEGARPRPWNSHEPFVLVSVGALDQPYKGTDVLLRAVSRLHRAGAPIRLRVVGEGRLRPALKQAARELDLGASVEFLGQQDRDGVVEALDAAHLFVLPSLTEGLPRALLEAMARGLPAVATDVGGVPELLPASCLVPAGDATALAGRIAQLISDDQGRQRLGERNRAHARRYHDRLQAPIRREFLRAVRRASAASHREARCA
jgi:phosphatidyl-myo-inositol dimannoside synthase